MSHSVERETLFQGAPPMPEGFTDRAAWDAIHYRFAGNGCAMDQAVIGWQRANQERTAAAARAATAPAGSVVCSCGRLNDSTCLSC